MEDIEQIISRLSELGVDVNIEDVENRYRLLVDKFQVPPREAQRSVLNFYLKEKGIALPSRKSEQVKINQIREPGRWVDLEAKVLSLFESPSPAISQAGILGDDTGNIRFVKWAKSGQPDLVEGKSYLLKNLVTDEFQGRFSVKINRSTVIEETDEPIEVSLNRRITGAIVDIQKGSGLIKRCPTCRRPLSKGMCTDHGKVEGVYDLRVKAVIDDGLVAQDILINRERVEELIGLTMEQAKEMAIEALDHEVVLALIEEKLIGRYFEVTGPVRDRYLLVDSINEMTFSDDDVSLLVSRAEGL